MCRIGRHAGSLTGVNQQADTKARDHGSKRSNRKPQDCLPRQASSVGDLAQVRNGSDYRSNDQRRNQKLQQADIGIANSAKKARQPRIFPHTAGNDTEDQTNHETEDDLETEIAKD